MNLIDKIYDKNIPRFFLGQSLGGIYGVEIGIKNPNYFFGIILFSPALKDKEDYYRNSKKLAKFLSYIIPSVALTKGKPGDSSKNPQNHEKVMLDKFIYFGGVRPGTITTVINAEAEVNKKLDKFNVPFLIFQGGIDKLVDIAGAFDIMEKSKSQDKTLLFYENAWHDLCHEQEIFDIIQETSKWILERAEK